MPVLLDARIKKQIMKISTQPRTSKVVELDQGQPADHDGMNRRGPSPNTSESSKHPCLFGQIFPTPHRQLPPGSFPSSRHHPDDDSFVPINEYSRVMVLEVIDPGPSPQSPQSSKSLRSFKSLLSLRRNSGQRNRLSATPSALTTVNETDISIWFSVFFGKPDPACPQLDHARFDAKVSEEVFGPREPDIKSPKLNNDSQNSLLQDTSAELPAFRAIVSLAIAHNDEIMSCVGRSCCEVCREQPAQTLVHRPLAATKLGYVELQDFEQVHRMMSTIASHTAHFTHRDEIDWSIGSVLSDRPYLCLLAVPTCSSTGICYQTATQWTQDYVDGILNRVIKPKQVEGGSCVCDRNSGSFSSSYRFSGTPTTQNFYLGGGTEPNSPQASFDNLDMKGSYTVTTTVFVGRPSLYISDPPQRGQFGCIVLSSTWPHAVLPKASKNEADDAIDYCRIAGFHEQHVLDSADYRCAVCSELVPATSLVHRPISFLRTKPAGPLSETLRSLIMRLSQFVDARWTFPEMNTALGVDQEIDAQIVEIAVPICQSGTICEEVARTAAREFVKLLLPQDMGLIFVGLDPDTDLSMIEEEDIDGAVDLTGSNPELLVRKIGSAGMLTEAEDRGEDPKDCVMTIAKLRHWYELCYAEEEAKREYLRGIGYKRSGADSDTESETTDEATEVCGQVDEPVLEPVLEPVHEAVEGELDESIHESVDEPVDLPVVWTYDRKDRVESSGANNQPVRQDSKARQDMVQRLERKVFFEPILTMEYWMVLEVAKRKRFLEKSLGNSDCETVK